MKQVRITVLHTNCTAFENCAYFSTILTQLGKSRGGKSVPFSGRTYLLASRLQTSVTGSSRSSSFGPKISTAFKRRLEPIILSVVCRHLAFV